LLRLAEISAADDNISVVFAAHPKFRPGRVERLFATIDWGGSRLDSFSAGNPRTNVSLQAADLLAYELRGLRRGQVGRWPLQKLRELGCQFELLSADWDRWSN
jgi:hypothetical protein